MEGKLTLAILLLVTACANQPPARPSTSTSSGATASLPTSPPLPALSSTPEPMATSLPNMATVPPTPLPTREAMLDFFDPLNPPRLDEISVESINSFAEFPGNQADGSPAPDFSARLMGGETFTLSERRGPYWLVLPTALGCGACMFSLNLLTQVTPQVMQVLVLDIYQPDLPEYWQSYAEYFGNPPYLWGVVDTPTFLEDYQIFGLGSFLVIDPQGNLVFKATSPPRIKYITHMFTFTQRQGVE